MSKTSLIYELNRCRTLQGKLRFLGECVKEKYPLIERFSIALYQPVTDSVRTFFTTSPESEAITAYDIPLKQSPSLQQITEQRLPRVITDLQILADTQGDAITYHTRTLVEQGWRSSFTCPLVVQGEVVGFLFYNSRTVDAFKVQMLQELEVFAQLITQVVYQDYATVKTLTASVYSAMALYTEREGQRCSSTGDNPDRVSHFTHLIASHLNKWSFTDRQIQNMVVFAPLHDIGKLATPDTVLMKPGKLTEEEYRIAQEHTWRGLDFIERIIEQGNLSHLPDIQMLRNIILYHHEKMDGTGYPDKLSGESIPIEARIIAVADVLDALLSDTAYRKAFTQQDALAELQAMSGHHLDADCVAALLEQADRLEDYRR